MRGALKPNQGIRLVMKEHGVEFWMAAEFTFLSERSFLRYSKSFSTFTATP